MYKQLILDNQERITKLSLFERSYIFHEDLLKLNKIVSFVWPRRVGKTFLMFQFIQELLSKNIIKASQLVFIDFSQFRNEELNPQELLDEYFETNPEEEPFLIFDEIQDIANFKEFTLFFYNRGYRLFLSGSNSKLLSSELATQFRWRVFQYDVFPLTFDEILRFKKIESKVHYTTQERWVLNQILKEILTYGTFPELVISENEIFKENILKDYLDVLIYKDLLERYKIENEYVIRYLIKRLVASNTKQVNVNKIYNDLKSLNIKVGKNLLYNGVTYLENIFFTKQINNFYSEKWFKKAFLFNIGFRTTLHAEKDIGKSFENLIFLHLVKKYSDIQYKDSRTEIDFFIEKENTNIQVCYELNDENFDRETSFSKESDCKNILVVKDIGTNKKIPSNIEVIDWIDFLAS